MTHKTRFTSQATDELNQPFPFYSSLYSQSPLNGFETDDDDEEEDAFPEENGQGNFRMIRISQEGEKKNDKSSKNKEHKDTPFLDKFSTDITKAAEEKLLDPVIGREKEIERLSQILSRRKKNNPILIGEPGVGKSAIVEGLATKIVEGTVPHTLMGKRLVRLDMASIVAGTKFRGQFEERMQNLISEMKEHDEVILFIDEIHTIIGAGASSGTMDAANLLKPALARGELQCIGATTLDEYRNSIEKDGALERRFQKIIVEAPTKEETLQILINLQERYEEHHHVKYTDEAIEQAVRLAERYLTDRSFPDKAIDIIDEAGSRAHMKETITPSLVLELNAKRAQICQEKMDAVKAGNYQLATNLRERQVEIEKEISQQQELFNQELEANPVEITAEMIAEVVSMISGVPVTKMAQAEGNQLKGMKETLCKEVIDQDDAVTKLVKAIQRSRIGLKDPNRPIGTFMFLGPTGVGKTLLAKELAKFMFGSSDSLIRIDMSEYMEKFTVSRLVGAPPGYVGYEEGGQLTEQVRRKPYSIVLLDEIEKAHPDVFNLLLQVMDEGRLTDSNGRTVDFRNSVIIMTSNVGSRQLKEFGQGIGFTSSKNTDANADSIIRKALQKQFAPEFLNRLDEIITFHPLELHSMLNIIDIELKKLIQRVEDMGYHLEVTDEARKFLAEKGFDPQYGARPLRRSIQTYLEDEISNLIINDEPGFGTTIIAQADIDKLTLAVTNCPIIIAEPVIQESLI
ncbi:MAG: ATP-dependent Clp protease ATP-binding subunit [Bacteroidaceae bacterium]|nr:ATP-dependent Clp protease ATP-binding subunit [Bacteroidaceae bacterium]